VWRQADAATRSVTGVLHLGVNLAAWLGHSRVIDHLSMSEDGKEGVRGSSPREGFTNPLLTSFLVVC